MRWLSPALSGGLSWFEMGGLCKRSALAAPRPRLVISTAALAFLELAASGLEVCGSFMLNE